MSNYLELIESVKNDINFMRESLNDLLNETEMILDGEVINKHTFETIRKATDNELELFYTIRIKELKLRNLQRA